PLRLCVRRILAKAPRRKVNQNRKQRYRRLRVVLRLALASLLLATVSLCALFIHSYRAYAKIVDDRLERGYLTSRAGIYAAPRTLQPGQKLSRDGLAGTLRRAGYVESDEASEVWNGSFIAHNN